jgi:anti-anti-sigma factor
VSIGSYVAPVDLGSIDPGTHLCAFPADGDQAARIATTFVSRGLSDGDRVLYVATDDQAETLLRHLDTHLDTEAALASGQLQISSFAAAYGDRRPDDLDVMADGFRQAAVDSRAAGFPALRVAAQMDELATLLGSVDETVRWERVSTGLQHEIGVSSVCLYSPDRLDEAQLASLTAEHAALAPDRSDAPLARFLAVHEPWGVRVVGEVDLSNRDQLRRVVLSRAAVTPRVTLDLRDLTFADVGTLSGLRAVAAGLPEDGWLALAHASAVVRRTLDICGLDHERMRVLP